MHCDLTNLGVCRASGAERSGFLLAIQFWGCSLEVPCLCLPPAVVTTHLVAAHASTSPAYGNVLSLLSEMLSMGSCFAFSIVLSMFVEGDLGRFHNCARDTLLSFSPWGWVIGEQMCCCQYF